LYRILDACRKRREIRQPKLQTNNDENEELKEQKRTRINRDKFFDSEYYSLPAIEKLSINVKEDEVLQKFGHVDSHIDFIGTFDITVYSIAKQAIKYSVKIKPLEGMPHLGYDTVLVDAEREPLGEIFEIFGKVTDTMYALRFNSKEEAAAKMPIGKEVYYLASNNEHTNTVFPNELTK
jgi:hypothetical protein